MGLSTTVQYKDMALSLKNKRKRKCEQNICSVKDKNNMKTYQGGYKHAQINFNKIMLAKYKTSIRLIIQMKQWQICGFLFHLKYHGQDNVRNHQYSSYNTYRFSNHIKYRFLYLLKSENTIYCAHIGVDLGMSTMSDVLCRYLNHSSRTKSLK